MRVQALVAFNAFGYSASAGEELTIEDKGQRLDLEKLGWIQPLGYEVSDDSEVKKATKKAKE